jgi:L-cysteine desulfidase
LILAATLGALCGNADLHLEVLRDVSQACIDEAKLHAHEWTKVYVAENTTDLYIEVLVTTTTRSAKVIIADRHDLIIRIEVDDQVVFDREHISEEKMPDLTDEFTLNDLFDFVDQVPIDRLGLIELSIKLNRAISIEGLQKGYGLQVGKIIYSGDIDNPGKAMSQITNYAVALAASGSDARMAGVMLPVMSNSGSGNQGICCTVPVVAVAEKLDLPYERLVRAVLLSNLVTIFIKRSFGRLSAMCGVIAASTGASCGVAYLMDGKPRQIRAAIQNMLGTVTGMLCDGAKSGCAMKVATGVFAAMQSAILAIEGMSISPIEGIVEDEAENTIMNLGRLAKEGMPNMNDVLLDIMLNKR